MKPSRLPKVGDQIVLLLGPEMPLEFASFCEVTNILGPYLELVEHSEDAVKRVRKISANSWGVNEYWVYRDEFDVHMATAKAMWDGARKKFKLNAGGADPRQTRTISGNLTITDYRQGEEPIITQDVNAAFTAYAEHCKKKVLGVYNLDLDKAFIPADPTQETNKQRTEIIKVNVGDEIIAWDHPEKPVIGKVEKVLDDTFYASVTDGSRKFSISLPIICYRRDYLPTWRNFAGPILPREYGHYMLEMPYIPRGYRASKEFADILERENAYEAIAASHNFSDPYVVNFEGIRCCKRCGLRQDTITKTCTPDLNWHRWLDEETYNETSLDRVRLKNISIKEQEKDPPFVGLLTGFGGLICKVFGPKR